MSLINIKNLSFSYSTNFELVFDNVTLQIDTDWKLGLIGKNGKGKTTLLRLLTKVYEYKGSIDSKVNFEYFPLLIEDVEDWTLNIINSYLHNIEEWKIRKELNLLDVDDNILYRSFNTLSNGEQVKVMLAILFLKENSFLLIDEPTNHLDLEGREVVAEYLNNKKGFILVSHDRNFLNNCIDHVMSINNTNIDVQQGNYDSWKMNKDNQDNFELVQNEKLKKDIKKLDQSAKRTAKWSSNVEKSKNLGKNSSKPRLDQGVKPDKGHIGRMAAKMMKRSKIAQNRQEQAIDDKKKLLKNLDVVEPLLLSYLKHHSSKLVEINSLSIFYDNLQIVDDLSFSIDQGDCVAIIGKNGSGKSSVLKLIYGLNIKYKGMFVKASNLKISYVSQDTSFLNGSLNHFIIKSKIDEPRFKSILRKLGFSRNQFDKDMGEYSSGQKKKVLIARSLCEEAHLYIWDEALNYLDIITRVQIENLILEYQPTILFVEHDKEFVDNVANKQIELTR